MKRGVGRGGRQPAEAGDALEGLRSSGAVQASFTEPDHHESNEHIALIYGTRAEQFATAVPFVRHGLERGEKCIYVVDDSSRAELFAAMENGGIDVEAARDAGELAVLTRDTYVSEPFTPENQLAYLADAIDDATGSFPAVRVAVEMTCFLDDDLSYDDLVAYEERYNEISAGADAMALCQYNRGRFPPEIVRDVIRAHPHLVVGETVGHNVYYTPPGSDHPSGEIDRMTTALADIARAETDLKRQNERLEAFAGVVSHDLRNPLNVAQGQLELLREGPDGDRKEHLDAVERAHDRIETLIDDLLSLARDGNDIGEPEPIDLGALGQQCWDNVETGASTLRIETEGKVIEANRTRLKQLLENLMRNSVEHGSTSNRATPDDTGRAGSSESSVAGGPADSAERDASVTVTLGALPAGFYVADDGPGVPESERERVFEAGYSTADGGSGLGMAIVGQIANAHGWGINVRESEAGGARFEITERSSEH